jgi:methionyl-tRNA synthetase
LGFHPAVSMSRQILVTSALPYANGSIHLGHLVEYIQTDIWVRFQKMRGHDCRYVCADDTHGTAIMLRAEKEGVTPEVLIARVWDEHTQDFGGFLIGFDHYHSTHSDENRDLASAIYLRLKDAGLIEVKTIAQLFDPVKNLFLPFHQGRVPQVRSRGPVWRQLRGVRRDLQPDRTEEPGVSGVRRNACAPGLRALLLQAWRLRSLSA